MSDTSYIILQHVQNFCNTYFTQRDAEKTLEQCIDTVHTIGTGVHEVAHNKRELKLLLEADIAEHPESFRFEFGRYHEQIIIPSEVISASLQIKVTTEIHEDTLIEYILRASLTYKRVKDTYKLCNCHVSVASDLQEDDEFFPLQLPSKKIESLKDDALTDPLTQVYNRRFVINKITELLPLPADIQASVLIIDLDNFKKINDHLGHLKGDKVLVQFSKICTDIIRKEDLFARIGGDEFLLLLLNQDEESISHIYQRIRNEFYKIFRTYIEEFNFNFSVGASLIQKRDTNFEDIYHRVDKLLYKVKKGGKSSFLMD